MISYIYSWKKIIFFVFIPLVLTSQFVNSQTIGDSTVYENRTDELEPSLTTTIPYTAFGGLNTDLLSLNKRIYVCPGVTIGMILSNKFLIGGYAGFLFNTKKLQRPETPLLNIKYEYGGVWLGYFASPIKNIQFGISSKFGKGHIELEDAQLIKYKNTDVLMVIPQLNLYITITRWMRLNISTGYRITTDLKMEPVSSHYLNGQNTTVGILFGEYGQGKEF